MSYNKLSLASLILGLAGLFCSGNIWCIPICIVSIVLGIVALTDYLAYKWPAICGIICAVAGWLIISYLLFYPYYVVYKVTNNFAEVVSSEVEKQPKTVLNIPKADAPEDVIPEVAAPVEVVPDVVQPSEKASFNAELNNNTPTGHTYHIGDVIKVTSNSGEYSLCITGVHETADRNEYSDKRADRVVVIDYSFENISYKVEFGDYHNNEKGISDWDFKMYDSDGNVLETYPVDVQYASAVSPGHKSSGQMAYALNNSDNYIEAEYHDNIFEGSDFTIELIW